MQSDAVDWGRTQYGPRTRISKIELATKVIDDPVKLFKYALVVTYSDAIAIEPNLRELLRATNSEFLVLAHTLIFTDVG